MRINSHAPRSRQRGVAMIETALTLPLVLLVLFGIINFGVALYNKSVITNASREAARNGIVYSSDDLDAIEAQAESYCVGRVINFGGSLECSASAQKVDGDETLKVSVNFTFSPVAGSFLGLGSNMPLASETLMKFEI